jgi:hypothetical protein
VKSESERRDGETRASGEKFDETAGKRRAKIGPLVILREP